MRAVVPLGHGAVDESHIRFVDQRRLEAVPHALSGHAAARDLVELLMDERDQSLAGGLVSLSPLEAETETLRVST
jgi:hypothetical protein